MMIELTQRDNEKVFLNTDKISEMYRNIETVNDIDQEYTVIEKKNIEDLVEVKETPEQIQDMIMLDEFAKCALAGSIVKNTRIGDSIETTAEEAYMVAKAMLEARKEALK
jgi:hypothetical protein